MVGTGAWINISSPTDPSLTGTIHISLDDEGVMIDVWDKEAMARAASATLDAEWHDLNKKGKTR